MEGRSIGHTTTKLTNVAGALASTVAIAVARPPLRVVMDIRKRVIEAEVGSGEHPTLGLGRGRRGHISWQHVFRINALGWHSERAIQLYSRRVLAWYMHTRCRAGFIVDPTLLSVPVDENVRKN